MSSIDTLPDGEIIGTWGGIDDLAPGPPLPSVGDALYAIDTLRVNVPGAPRTWRNPSALVMRDDGSLAVAVRFGGTGWDEVWLLDRTGEAPRLEPIGAWATAPAPYPADQALAEVARILGL
jgi:hypothetical protein